MIYVFDLDGTLCTSEEDPKMAHPLKERIRKVNLLYNLGHRIIIETARGSQTGIDWRRITQKQLKEWKVKYHKLRTGEKIFGDIYVDDRAVNDKEFFK
jgi:dTDP-glucose 4,6-dehydratase